jgi:hypothetical protein
MKVAIQFISILIVFIIPVGCEDFCNRPSNCSLEPETGSCYAIHRKYYYDPAERRCKEFTWGGCGGVVPFNTLAECQACECSQ